MPRGSPPPAKRVCRLGVRAPPSSLPTPWSHRQHLPALHWGPVGPTPAACCWLRGVPLVPRLRRRRRLCRARVLDLPRNSRTATPVVHSASRAGTHRRTGPTLCPSLRPASPRRPSWSYKNHGRCRGELPELLLHSPPAPPRRRPSHGRLGSHCIPLAPILNARSNTCQPTRHEPHAMTEFLGRQHGRHKQPPHWHRILLHDCMPPLSTNSPADHRCLLSATDPTPPKGGWGRQHGRQW